MLDDDEKRMLTTPAKLTASEGSGQSGNGSEEEEDNEEERKDHTPLKRLRSGPKSGTRSSSRSITRSKPRARKGVQGSPTTASGSRPSPVPSSLGTFMLPDYPTAGHGLNLNADPGQQVGAMSYDTESPGSQNYLQTTVLPPRMEPLQPIEESGIDGINYKIEMCNLLAAPVSLANGYNINQLRFCVRLYDYDKMRAGKAWYYHGIYGIATSVQLQNGQFVHFTALLNEFKPLAIGRGDFALPEPIWTTSQLNDFQRRAVGLDLNSHGFLDPTIDGAPIPGTQAQAPNNSGYPQFS
jgi:hypothetical protein